MARTATVTFGLATWALLSVGVLADRRSPERQPVPHVQIADSVARGAVVRAIRGAASRLNRPACQRVLADFQDSSGKTLLAGLEASTGNAAAYLLERVWFADGSDVPQCLTDQATAAFTAAGNKVVWVCAARFANRFAREMTAAEVLIIHEMLHTLGLSENPPSSGTITRQVVKRCGGS